jgi:hypothetical protein
MDLAFFESLFTGGHGSEIADAGLLQVNVGLWPAVLDQGVGANKGRWMGGDA